LASRVNRYRRTEQRISITHRGTFASRAALYRGSNEPASMRSTVAGGSPDRHPRGVARTAPHRSHHRAAYALHALPQKRVACAAVAYRAALPLAPHTAAARTLRRAGVFECGRTPLLPPSHRLRAPRCCAAVRRHIASLCAWPRSLHYPRSRTRSRLRRRASVFTLRSRIRQTRT